ncbi:MAG: AMP-binding protein [Acidobacteriota bacterium]
MFDVYHSSLTDLPPLDDVIGAAMGWHFDESTGSRFWLAQARRFPFDPRRDVKTRADLALFPDVSAAWEAASLDDLLPQGCVPPPGSSRPWAFSVYETGGTTGQPRRIAEMTSRCRGVEWVSRVLESHGFPGVGQGHWLHIGPTGPHIVGRSVGLLAHQRRAFCYTVDFDPRWVRKCLREGRPDEAKRYGDHIIDQAVSIVRSQPVSVLFATPPILEAICRRPEIQAEFARKIRGILWAGTSVSPETLRLIEDEFFPEATLVGLYGNTLMGIACQRPRRAGDAERCVFQPFHPFCLIDLLDPATHHPVAHGESGQVRTTLMTPEMFLPNNVERDLATRVHPADPFDWDGVADVRPLPSAGSVIEGVY